MNENSYTFPSPRVTAAVMANWGYGPSDLCDAVTDLIHVNYDVEVFIDAPNDDDVCEVTGPRNLAPNAIENLILEAITDITE